MSLFKRFSDYFSSQSSVDEAGYWVFVRCDRCQEPFGVRVNLHHDLSVDYDGKKDQSFHSRKTIVGRKGCFQRIEVELTFDQKRRLIDREITGGIFIEEDEYLAEEITG